MCPSDVNVRMSLHCSLVGVWDRQVSPIRPFDLNIEVDSPTRPQRERGRSRYSLFRLILSSKFFLDLKILYYTFSPELSFSERYDS